MKKTMIILAMLIVVGSSCEKSMVLSSFTTNKEIYDVGEMVVCTNTSINASSYVWTANGQIGENKNFSPIFSSPGTYKISLSAIGAGGSDTFSHSIIVVSKKKKGDTISLNDIYYSVQ